MELVGLECDAGLAPTTTIGSYLGIALSCWTIRFVTANVTWTYGPVLDGELVTFFDGTTAIGPSATANGIAIFTTTLPTKKTHTIKATYPGDATFSRVAAKVTQVVNHDNRTPL